jgi:hypothetical protein
MPDLTSDILGRISRLPLPRSERGALTPLMEAISNSIHSVTDRFGDQTQTKGKITIRVSRDLEDPDTPITGFDVIDNGVGFTDQNYKSFCTPDSRLKEARGGKGIGRLAWLKVFEHISVDSTFSDGDTLRRRQFTFRLAAHDQIHELDDPDAPISEPQTTVSFRDFRPTYAGKVPARPETLQSRIVSHFIPLFIAGNAPQIVIDDGPLINVETVFGEHIVDQKTDNITIILGDEPQSFEVWSLKCDKSVRFARAGIHFVFLAGDKRSVDEFPIDAQLGLQLLDGENFYIACVNSPYLDQHVNAERTKFTFDNTEHDQIRREVVKVARDFLAPYVEEALVEKQHLTTEIIQENPQFIHVMGNVNEFVVTLPPNLRSREDIFLELSRNRFRRQRRFETIRNQIHMGPVVGDAVQEKVAEYMAYVSEEKKGALAEYVVRRKAILDLFEKLLEYKDYERETYSREDAIHNLICPMKVDSTQLDIGDHNLWMIDDRLPFYKFYASDLELRRYADTDNADRPDLAFFYDACLAWREGENTDTVVIVEFKRPMREDYSTGRDPVQQVLHYVEELKAGRVLTPAGRPIRGISASTAFHCYVVADITPQLREKMIGRFQRTPDGEGFSVTRPGQTRSSKSCPSENC